MNNIIKEYYTQNNASSPRDKIFEYQSVHAYIVSTLTHVVLVSSKFSL